MEIREYKEYDKNEIMQLYGSVGWTAYTDAPLLLEQGFANSLLVLAAYENDALLGLIRAVGDGATIVYVQDILVYPEFQRKGVGSALMKAMLERFGQVRQIVLCTDDTEKTIAFYESLGFRQMTQIGCCGFMKI